MTGMLLHGFYVYSKLLFIRHKKNFLFTVCFLSKLFFLEKNFSQGKLGMNAIFFKLSIMLYWSILLALYINLHQYFCLLVPVDT